MDEEKQTKLVKKLIQCPFVKLKYDKQSSYYLEFIWDDWEVYMFTIYQEHLEEYIKWKLSEKKDKTFHRELIDIILNN